MVSSARSLRSRVVPEGTVMPDSVMVAQSACNFLADTAPSGPEKVHDARLANEGDGVFMGCATGVASTSVAQAIRASDPRV